MIVTYAIEGYLKFMKETLLSDFSDILLNGYVYDESMDFNSRASAFIRKQMEFQKAEGTEVTDWAFIVWSRGDLSSSFTSRPTKISIDSNNDGVLDSTATMKMGAVEVQMKVYTNNVELAETIEEYFHVYSGELTHFDANYVHYGKIMKCSVDPDTTTTFEKEELAEVGSTIGIGINGNIHFPVIVGKQTVARIEHIHSIIWDGLSFEDENKQKLYDEWILTPPPE